MLYIRDNLGNECEAETPAAAGRAAESLLFDGGGQAHTITITTEAITPERFEEELRKIVQTVAERHGLG